MPIIKGVLITPVIVKKPSEKLLLTLAFDLKEHPINMDEFSIHEMGTDTITMIDIHGKKIVFSVSIEAVEGNKKEIR